MSPTHPRRQPKKKALAKDNPRRKKSAKRPPAGKLFEDLLALQARLRAPKGCPWDREQTHATLRTFLLEETHEVLDAMDSGDPKKFANELGDLLLQIIFHSLIASESNQFEIRDVIQSIHEKMVRRHPHVFGKVKADTSAQVLKNWEQLKAEERRKENGAGKPAPKSDSILSSVPRTLPALMEVHQITRRAANIGFDWNKIEELLEKLEEEMHELREELKVAPVYPEQSRRASPPASDEGNPRNASHTAGATKPEQRVSQTSEPPPQPTPAVAEEIGDLLFTAANLARFAGLDPELTLKKANRKFTTRFQWMEQEAQRRGAKLAETPRDQMETLWNESKAQRKPQQA